MDKSTLEHMLLTNPDLFWRLACVGITKELVRALDNTRNVCQDDGEQAEADECVDQTPDWDGFELAVVLTDKEFQQLMEEIRNPSPLSEETREFWRKVKQLF